VNRPDQDWDPRSTDVQQDQRVAYDAMRSRCPVAWSDDQGWTIFRHRDVLRALMDPETFSNRVSKHPAVPNGMDPPEHTTYRAVIVPYFSETRMRMFEPVGRAIAADLATEARQRSKVEAMREFALVAAVRFQAAFLGWPAETRDFLIDWIERSNRATHARDRAAQAAVAEDFERFIGDLIAAWRLAGVAPDRDVMASLLHEEVYGRPLNDGEIAAVLRNWTAGEIGTIAASIGIVIHYLAAHQDIQARLRSDPSVLATAIDEILRIEGPLVMNRRVTTRAVELGGRAIGANERVALNWVSANRDETVFGDPDEFRLDRNPDDNLLYGAGIHVCPGAPLARLELRLTLEELLARTARIDLDPDAAPELALFPASGYASLPVVFT